MPSPVGHALGGLLIGLAVLRTSAATKATRGAPAAHSTPGTFGTLGTLGTLSLCACLPDLDFLWGRHNMETHSLVVALGVGLLVYLLDRPLRGRGAARLAFGCALAWASHVVFDWLGSDDAPPLGVMALWPLSADFYFAHAYVFEAISRRYAEPGFWPQNIWALAKELLMLGPPVLVLGWWRLKRRPARDGAGYHAR